MDVRPSPAQQLLASTAREYLRRHHPIETIQRPVGAPTARAAAFDEKLWRGMAELGWAGLLVPGEHGGSDGSLLDVVLLVEELGYAGVPGPFVTSAVAATALLLAGASDAQQARLLPGLAGGARIATLALVEETGRFAADTVTAEITAGGLRGRKRFVKDADLATDLLVVVRGGVAIVPADARGITRVALDTLGDERLFDVSFDGVPVGDGDRIEGRAALAAALRAGALARTAELVGAAQRVLEMAVEHARTRVQGGRPIGGHQAIQHACADMVRDVDASRELLHLAAWKASEGREAAADVATAKAYAGEACLAVARRAHQIFGAISYCDEHPLHVFHERMLAASMDFGDAALHLETVAHAIGLEP
ncbi:MAG TPA: acyl-CoA dehydrogenase family protein [Terriglobales bacterium]|nr:acyl-CoA dehydrogenase family protein [Terriglobales bacterium]